MISHLKVVFIKLLLNNNHFIDRLIGGAKRDRTADLLRARQALSQLSYGPSISHIRSIQVLRLNVYQYTSQVVLSQYVCPKHTETLLEPTK